MLDITRENLKDFLGRRFIVAFKEELSDLRGVRAGDSLISHRTGRTGYSGSESNSIGVLTLKNKSLDKLMCIKIMEFSETGNYVRATMVSNWHSTTANQEMEEWFEVENLLDSLEFLDMVPFLRSV